MKNFLISSDNFGPIDHLRTQEERKEFKKVATNTNPMVEPKLEEQEKMQIIDTTLCAESTEKRTGELYETITMIEETGILPQEEILRSFEKEINQLKGKETAEDTLYH